MAVAWVWRLVAAVLVLTALVWGVRRESTWTLVPGGTVVVPVGPAPSSFGDAVGLDGIRYGPLAFAVGNGRLVVADTYRHRLAWRSLHGGAWHYLAWPDSFLDDVVYWPADRSFLVVDNRLPGLYVWRSGAPRLVWRVWPERGTAGAIWCVTAGAGPVAYGEAVAIGRGGFRVEWIAVTSRGARLVAWRTFDLGAQHADAHGMLGSRLPLNAVWVGPEGAVYAVDDEERSILVLRPDGQVGTRIMLPAAAQAPYRWLGMDDQGRLYALAGGVPDRLLVLSDQGQVLGERAVSPAALRAARYGAVAVDGTVYVDTSTGDRFRIASWRWIRKVRITWRW